MKLKIPKPPLCPFCKRVIPKPTFLPIGFSDYQAGLCECGAIFVVDETGFSRGAVFLEALLIACDGDWELALSLLPNEDYQEIWIENYDPLTHTIPGSPMYEGRKIRGALCFIKLTEDLEELKAKDREKKLSKEDHPFFSNIKEEHRRKLSRKELESKILNGNWEEIILYILGEPLNLHNLQKLLYHPEESVRKKTSLIIGKACSLLALSFSEKVLDFLKRLLYASADSAASPWGAVEAIGEIIRETGTRYEFFIKNLFGFLHYPEYRTSTLYALYRISEKSPQLIKKNPYLRLLTLFPKASSLDQGLIIGIFTNLQGKELFSYKNYLQADDITLFDYKTLSYKTLPLSSLWEEYEKKIGEKIK
ncbi:MAG: DVU0298 family protein [Caldimicrobium sp.]